MRRLAQHCLVVAPIALAMACGGSSTIEPGAGGGGGASSSSSTGTSSTSSGSSCADFLPPGDLGSSVAIRIQNDTAADLFIGDPYQSCGPVQTYALFDASGEPPSTEPLLGTLTDCAWSCEQLQSTDCACAAGCMAPHVIRVAAGGALVTEWVGYLYADTEMPAECFSDPMCAPSCLLETVAPDEVQVRATVYPTVSCGGGSGECTCELDADGSCTIWEGTPTVSGTAVEASTTWNAGEATVTVAFLL